MIQALACAPLLLDTQAVRSLSPSSVGSALSPVALLCGALSAAALCGLAGIVWSDGETDAQQALRFVLAAQLGAGCMGYQWLGEKLALRAATSPRRVMFALLFLALQLHPVLVAAVFRQRDWVWAVLVQLAAVAGVGLVAVVPRARRLDTALLAVGGATAFEAAVLGPTRGVEWFVPFYAAMVAGAFALGFVRRGDQSDQGSTPP